MQSPLQPQFGRESITSQPSGGIGHAHSGTIGNAGSGSLNVMERVGSGDSVASAGPAKVRCYCRLPTCEPCGRCEMQGRKTCVGCLSVSAWHA